jgi:2,3-bisphosphoglycerate-independent phosphoglycerate mutase
VKGEGKAYANPIEALKASYAEGVTDEFVKPCVIGDAASSRIQANDAVICFNFRTDRCREITQALTQSDFADQGMHTLPLHYTTMTRYDDDFKGVHVAFDKENLTDTLGETLAKAGLTQLRLAETEKYPHVTFFFSGGRETPFDGEARIMANSPKVATYDLQPEMSINPLVDQLLPHLREHKPNYVCLNFANPDMVGHTGVFDAVVKAVEATDAALGRVLETGLELGYSFVIIADHGNADKVVNPDGSPNTAHTTNPVPIVVVDAHVHKVKDGKLADVAPTLLKLLGMKKPDAMTGLSLV